MDIRSFFGGKQPTKRQQRSAPNGEAPKKTSKIAEPKPHTVTPSLARLVIDSIECNDNVRRALRRVLVESPTVHFCVGAAVNQEHPRNEQYAKALLTDIETQIAKAIPVLRRLPPAVLALERPKIIRTWVRHSSQLDDRFGLELERLTSMYELLGWDRPECTTCSFGNLFAKSTCQRVFDVEQALLVCTALGLPPPSFEGKCYATLMACCMQRNSRLWDGQTAVDLHKTAPRNGYKNVVWIETLSKAYTQLFAPKTKWWTYKKAIQQWWGSATLDSLPIGLMIVEERYLYVRRWYEMETYILDAIVRLTENDPPQHSYNAKEPCAICLEKVDAKDATTMQCKHRFHDKCLLQWLETAQTCPLCRAAARITECAHTAASIDRAIDELDGSLSPGQRDGLRLTATHRVCAIVGAGGTGKSHVAAALGELERSRYPNELSHFMKQGVVIAPTGKAAVNLAKRLDKKHFLVSSHHAWILSEAYHPSAGCNIPVLLMEEASMTSLWDLHFILHTAEQCGVQRLVLFGDTMQLPPVQNDGTLLHALEQAVPSNVVTLRQNHRTNARGLLSLLQRLRDRRRNPASPPLCRSVFETANTELHILPPNNAKAMASMVLQQVRRFNAADVRVLSTKRKRSVLLDVQEKLHERCCAPIFECFNANRRGGAATSKWVFGDRVVSTKNVNLDVFDDGTWSGSRLLVANGSEGRVLSVQYEGSRLSCMRVAFDDAPTLSYPDPRPPTPYPDVDTNAHHAAKLVAFTTKVRTVFETLERADINTVHKFQGSQAPIIVAVFTGNWKCFNTLELLYTAASRAETRLILLMEQATLDSYCIDPGTVQHNHVFTERLKRALR